jgi:hypothetical protein
LTEIRNNSSVTLPSEVDEEGNKVWDVKYLESQMRGYDFESYLKRLDQEMAKAIFLPELLFDAGRVGSYKLGDVHKNTFLMLLNALMNDIKLYIDKYIITQIVEYNFPPSRNGKLQYPEFKYERQGTISTPIIVDLIKEMTKKGKVDVKIEDIARITGVPLMTGKNPDVQKTTPVEEKTKQDSEKPQKDENSRSVIVNVNSHDEGDSISTMFEKFQNKVESCLSELKVTQVKTKQDDQDIQYLVQQVKGSDFYDDIMNLASSQVGRIENEIQTREFAQWNNVKLGYRASLEKIWVKYVHSNTDGLYDGAKAIVSAVLLDSKRPVPEVRTQLWKVLTDFYFTAAFKKNTKLALSAANKVDSIISAIV